MAGGRIVDILVSIDRLIAALKRTAPILAVVVLVLIVGFGMFALKSLSGHPPRAGEPGVAEPVERGGGVFEELWTAAIGRIQDLVLTRPDAGAPLELVVLTGNRITRFDLDGRVIGRLDAPEGAFRLSGDVTGRARLILASSIESYWSWKDLRRIGTAYHLTAFDALNQIRWTHTARTGPGSSPFEALITDLEPGGEIQVIADAGARILGLDLSGHERWTMPKQFRSLVQSDVEGDRSLRVLVMRAAGRNTELEVLGADRQLRSLTAITGYSTVDFCHLAQLGSDSEPVVATLGVPSVPDADGKFAEQFGVMSLSGTPRGRAKLPWPVRPIVVRPLSTIDTDGDGRRAWIAAGDDGVFYLFSADSTGQEAHHTGSYIHRFAVVPRPGSGDLLVLGTNRGIHVWKRRSTFGSAVD
jgi:hypothetical protein